MYIALTFPHLLTWCQCTKRVLAQVLHTNNNVNNDTTGDRRVNEQVLLVLFHTVWARHHNHLASRLKNINPSWNDEELFQEARRIVGAQLQHVTYNEYLPPIFGMSHVRQSICNLFPSQVIWQISIWNCRYKFIYTQIRTYDNRSACMNCLPGENIIKDSKLKPLKNKKRKNFYIPDKSAAISAEFATAAFRFGHSQIAVSWTFMLILLSSQAFFFPLCELIYVSCIFLNELHLSDSLNQDELFEVNYLCKQ